MYTTAFSDVLRLEEKTVWRPSGPVMRGIVVHHA
jgi:hypothetical protein